jgi:hypothetical protein
MIVAEVGENSINAPSRHKWNESASKAARTNRTPGRHGNRNLLGFTLQFSLAAPYIASGGFPVD